MKIVDFGVSKQLKTRARSMSNPSESVGSPQYMSPEQISTPSEVDARTDIWSLGVVMFELLTGALPVQRSGAGPGLCFGVESPRAGYLGISRRRAARARIHRVALLGESSRATLCHRIPSCPQR